MNAGDVCLAYFPYGGAGGRKLRPVLLVTGPIGSVPEYLTAYITSVLPPDPLPSDIGLDPSQPEFQGTGLTKASVLRMHKICTVHQRDLMRELGVVPGHVLTEARKQLGLVIHHP